jgi:hypothetical protein
MEIKPGKFCPLIKKDCIELKCSWFTQVRGKNPNTGKDVDEWGCAIAWMPVLTIETAQQSRQAGAAVESFRNEMVKANQSNLEVLLAVANQEPTKVSATIQDPNIKKLEN